MKLNILNRKQFSSNYKKILEKTENQSYDYGCIMGYFNENPLDKLTDKLEIKSDDLYNNEENEYGLEIEPHCTILYGIHDNEVTEEEIVNTLKIFKLFDVKFDKISAFENEKYDVLKFDLDSDSLHIMNKIICSLFPYTSSFPNYHPHCTIAYLKPGLSKEYISIQPENISLPINCWVYSQANGRKISIDIDGNVKVLREATEMNENINTITNYDIIDYNGYEIRINKSIKFKESYIFSIYKNNNYIMGIKGPTTYDNGLETCKSYIDNL